MLTEILSAALTFFCTKMNIFLAMLTTDLTTYNGGGVWNSLMNVHTILLTIAITIADMFIWVELIETTTRWIEIRKASVLIFFLIQIVGINAVIYHSKDILITVYSIVQGVTKSVMTSTGMMTTSGDILFNVTVPDELYDAVDTLTLVNAAAVFIVIIIISIWICVSTISVVMLVYVRLFNLYLLIVISPLAFACAMSRKTRFIFGNFLKTFMSVAIEAIVMVLVMYIFKNLLEQGINVDINSKSSNPGIFQFITDTTLTAGGLGKFVQAKNLFLKNNSADVLVVMTYLLEMSFLFAVMLGMVKGAERIVNKVFGI